MRNDNSASQILTGDIAAQVLGLTEQHIYFFEPEMNSKKLGIHQLMLNDFLALSKAAAQADIELKIASGYRSFERQLLIWNNKFTGKTAIKNAIGETVNISQLTDIEIIHAILLFSALPGTSRHHWGTDIDLNNFTNKPSGQIPVTMTGFSVKVCPSPGKLIVAPDSGGGALICPVKPTEPD